MGTCRWRTKNTWTLCRPSQCSHDNPPILFVELGNEAVSLSKGMPIEMYVRPRTIGPLKTHEGVASWKEDFVVPYPFLGLCILVPVCLEGLEDFPYLFSVVGPF